MLFSIIMPVYNRAIKVGSAIESVLDQSFDDWELIVIDDGSTDETSQILQSYSSKDKRIKLITLPENSGPAVARNKGINVASGQYISMLDSDDIFLTNYLENIHQCLSATKVEVGFAYPVFGYRHQSGKPSDTLAWRISDQYANKERPFLYERKIGASGITFKKEVFEQSGLFDERLNAAEDTEFLIRICKSFKGLPVDQLLIKLDRTGTDRLTKQYNSLANAHNIIIEKYWEEIKNDPYLINKWLYKGIWLNYYAGKRQSAESHFTKLKRSKFTLNKMSAIYYLGKIIPRTWFINIHKTLDSIRRFLRH